MGQSLLHSGSEPLTKWVRAFNIVGQSLLHSGSEPFVNLSRSYQFRWPWPDGKVTAASDGWNWTFYLSASSHPILFICSTHTWTRSCSHFVIFVTLYCVVNGGNRQASRLTLIFSPIALMCSNNIAHVAFFFWWLYRTLKGRNWYILWKTLNVEVFGTRISQKGEKELFL